MNKLLVTTAISMVMASTVTFAHHPAADIVDAEIYAMIDENVSDVHAEMTFDDMGGDTTDIGSNAESSTEVGSASEARAEMNSMADQSTTQSTRTMNFQR